MLKEKKRRKEKAQLTIILAPPPIQRTPLLKYDARNYDEVYKNFNFEVPEYFNIGHEVCDKFFPKHEYLKEKKKKI